MNQLKQIVIAVSAALAIGTMANVEAGTTAYHAIGQFDQLAKGGKDSARDKIERKAVEELQLAKGGKDSAHDKTERKGVEELQVAKGGKDSARDKTERTA